MWNIDLSFLQLSANVFKEYFLDKYYKIYTTSGKTYLIINTVQNYPHLVGIKLHKLARLGGSEYLFDSIINNDTDNWSDEKKAVFNSIFPNGVAYGLNDIKITFFPMMPEIFINNNYVLSVNYDKNKREDNKPFDTEVLISDFNEGMNIGMRQKEDMSFGFNSWRVEESEEAIMDMYKNQTIDLIKKIEQYEDGIVKKTKVLKLSYKNIWRLSRLKKDKGTTFLDSEYNEKIDFLTKYDSSEFEKGIIELLDEFPN